MTVPRIVLLGNDSSSLSLMHTVLTDEGYRTLRCRPQDVTDAHAVVKREDGWAFLARMCADLETADIPAIIASGQMERLPKQDELLRTMACQMLATPFDADELLRAIVAALGPSPASQARAAPAAVARAVRAIMI